MTESPVARAILVGVMAALLFLALKAVVGGIETSDYVVAPAAGIGSAVGFHIGRRRSERRQK